MWKPRAPLLIAVISAVTATLAQAASKSSLENDNWIVVAKTTVSGTFNGCDYDLPVPLDGGYTFLCQEYNYHYAYRPDFIVMERENSRKYVIDNQEFMGTLYRGTPTMTHVMGEFRGCDFNRVISLENGLLFKCGMYHYHYAYHPEVVIFGSSVSIDGEKYQGVLYQQ
jgi:hypothetical protein